MTNQNNPTILLLSTSITEVLKHFVHLLKIHDFYDIRKSKLTINYYLHKLWISFTLNNIAIRVF